MAEIPSLTLRIIDLLEKNGAKDILIVGGFVRDKLLGIPSKDVDVEVYGLSYAQIRNILSPHFHVDLVGQAFGVIKVGNIVDVALPRRESKTGLGHKGFDVEAIGDLSPQEAFARRDFTINAIGMRKDGSFCDPYDGIGDLKRHILRATSPAFKDDPLRVLRGMQFAARFGFKMDPTTVQYCREVFDEFSTLSEERVYEEWKKWALKGVYPDQGLDVLTETGWINAFPELAALVGCSQNPQWHPEGDVWTHTKQVCKEASKAIKNFTPELSEDERVSLMFAALCHDMGKPSTTTMDENGVIRTLGHAKAGAPIARGFLERMKAPKRVVSLVEPLVAEHMGTQQVDENGPSPRTIRRLAQRLAPANIKLWTMLCQSDAYGCGVAEPTVQSSEAAEANSSEPRKIRFQADVWFAAARKLDLTESEPKPIIQGRDLLQLGLKPGPQMGTLLKELFEDQIEGKFTTREAGLELLRQKINQ